MKGRIKNFKEEKGYGFILGEDGCDYFVHISNIINSENIHSGMFVSFEPNENEKGKFATKIEITQTNKPLFIAFNDIRIKISNIKDYGINTKERYLVKLYREEKVPYLLSYLLYFVDTGKYVEINETQYHNFYRSENYKKYVQLESGVIRQTQHEQGQRYIKKSDLLKKTERYLFVTTYQNDNYIFWEDETNFNIEEKRNEIDKYML